MSWPVAIFACFCVLVIFVFLFLLIVYSKEYTREEKLLKEFSKSKQPGSDAIYIIQPQPKKKAAAFPKVEKNKKDIN
jgi:hypothetical protein